MRVHVIHAHPVETSFNRALFSATVESLEKAGHKVDALNLYEEDFPAVLTREERLGYHDIPNNLTLLTLPYVERLKAANVPCDLVMYVHDELQFDCNPAHVEYASEVIKRSLSDACSFYDLTVNMTCDTQTGRDWSESH